MRPWQCRLFYTIVGLVLLAPGLRAGTPTAANDFFESKIRPLLVERCFKCHTGNKPKGGLRIDSRAALLRGGESGAAIVPGKPEASLLITAVRHGEALKMPPQRKLPAGEVAALASWVAMGAPWPGTDGKASTSATATNQLDATFTAEQRNF